MENNSLTDAQIEKVFAPIHDTADGYMVKCLLVHVGVAFFLAFFYDTWLLATAISALSLIAWFGTKALLPNGEAHRYVMSLLVSIGVKTMHFQCISL